MWFRKKPFLQLTKGDGVELCELCSGTLVSGSTGSGKTSGPGETIARRLLQAGAGFLVLCAKADEQARWERLCRQTGRSKDLVIFAPGTGVKCDLLNYSLSHPEATVEDSARLLGMLIEIESRSEGKGDEMFWRLASEKHLRHAINAVWKARDKCSLTDVYELLVSAPKDLAQMKDATWQKDSLCAQCLAALADKYPDEYDVNLTGDYWIQEWPNLSEKTRSVIYTMTTNILDKFLSGVMQKMLSSGETTFTPEDVMAGKVCVLGMPFLKWGAPARMFQVMFKTLVQKAVLRRSHANPPVVVWQDEGQIFLTDYDVQVQAVARQSGLINVILTQSLPVLYESLGGGPKAEQSIKALLGNLQWKFICQQSDPDSCKFFSELCGGSKHLFGGASISNKPFDYAAHLLGIPQEGSYSFNEQWFPDLPPEFFAGSLRKGTKGIVDAIVFGGGRTFSNGKPWVFASFKQDFGKA